jgi:hypothetical protein
MPRLSWVRAPFWLMNRYILHVYAADPNAVCNGMVIRFGVICSSTGGQVAVPCAVDKCFGKKGFPPSGSLPVRLLRFHLP